MGATDQVQAAVQELTAAMAGLLRALDAAGDEDVSGVLGDALPDALQELATRISAVAPLDD